MKRFFLTALALALFVCGGTPFAWADDAASEKAADQAALRWLQLIDQGKYDQSWRESAPIVQKSIDMTKWSNTIKSVRESVGKMQSRTLQKAQYVTQLPGAPAGKYVVLLYSTRFANQQVVETVTPMLCPDGKWRVSGYYLRPSAH